MLRRLWLVANMAARSNRALSFSLALPHKLVAATCPGLNIPKVWASICASVLSYTGPALGWNPWEARNPPPCCSPWGGTASMRKKAPAASLRLTHQAFPQHGNQRSNSGVPLDAMGNDIGNTPPHEAGVP